MCENQFPPILLYDTEISRKTLSSNLPYRNIGHLIFDNPSAITVLKLCGAEETLLENGSDYEKFSALCSVFPSLPSHKVRMGIEAILYAVCGESVTLSPYCAEELWTSLNALIDELELTPLDLLERLNVESVCTRILPFEELSLPSNTPVDVYPVIDMTDLLSFMVSDKNGCASLEKFLASLKKYACYDLEDNASALRVALSKDYKYIRCNKKQVLCDVYTALISGKTATDEEKNGLLTYIYVECARFCEEKHLNLIVEPLCGVNELDKLLAYLKLNKILPDSMPVICDDIMGVCDLADKYSVRNDYGLPSIVPVTGRLEECAEHFPIGMTLEYQKGIKDIISAAALIAKRNDLKARLSLISDEFNELYEDIVYTNIKNRMRI